MLLNIVSLFCLEAVSLVSRSSFSSPGKLGITLGFSQTWKWFGFSQPNKIKRRCLYSGFASIYSLNLPVEPNCNTLVYTFKDSLTVSAKLWWANIFTREEKEKEKDVLVENAVISWNSRWLEIKKPFTCKENRRSWAHSSWMSSLKGRATEGAAASAAPALEVVDGGTQ